MGFPSTALGCFLHNRRADYLDVQHYFVPGVWELGDNYVTYGSKLRYWLWKMYLTFFFQALALAAFWLVGVWPAFVVSALGMSWLSFTYLAQTMLLKRKWFPKLMLAIPCAFAAMVCYLPFLDPGWHQLTLGACFSLAAVVLWRWELRPRLLEVLAVTEPCAWLDQGLAARAAYY